MKLRTSAHQWVPVSLVLFVLQHKQFLHLRRGFSLISRAWRALLTSCLAHHRVGLAEPCSRWDSLARSEPLGVVTGDERSRQSSSGEFFKSRTTEESGFEAEPRAQRDKTARLRALRLARDEEGGWSTVRKQWRI